MGQISAKLVHGLPTWSLKRTLNLPWFSFPENRGKRFLAAYYLWRDYNRWIMTPKLSVLMHTRKGTTIVTQQEKVTNETQQQMNNLLRTFCSVRSSCCRESIFSYLRLAVFILSQANFYSINFLKVRHFPGKIANKPLPGVFSWSCSPATIDFQKRPSSDVYMARDLSRICLSLGRLAA